jgi:large repetitive protein
VSLTVELLPRIFKMNLAPFSVRFLRICLGMAFFAASALAQSSNPSARITQAIDETSRMPLTGSTPRAIRAAHDLGAVESNHSLQHIILVLTPSPDQKASLKRLIDDQHNKNSSVYHKWLTPEQFAAKFGPSDDDLATVKTWLQSQGLNPTAVGRGRQWIEFAGAVQQVNNAFATSMHRFELNGQTHIANSSDISVPAALTPVVAGALSLNDFQKQPAHSKVVTVKRNGEGKPVPVNPNFTNTNGNGDYFYNLAPADFQTIYNETPLLKSGVNGAGISIAIAGRSDISLADVQTFRQTFGLPQNDPNIILNGADPGYPNYGQDQVESTLDVEWAGATAPGATINLVESGSSDTTDGIDLSSVYIVDNALSPIMSVSYGECEALMGPNENAFYNSLWEQAAAEGITVFVATGDGGAAQCDANLQELNLEPQGPALNGPTINGLASTPFDIAVGGTQFNEAGNYSNYWSPNNNSVSGSALGNIPEQAWNESCDPTLPQTGTNCINGQTYYVLEAGGGGPSNCSQASVDNQGNETCIAGYPKPSWQTGTGVPTDGVRDTPDLSLNASPDDDGYLVCINSSCQTETLNGQTVLAQWGAIGGTSASAPSMAGIMALVEQKNGAFQGQANYVFYKLAAMDSLSSCNSSLMTNLTQPSSCNFNDITRGSNGDPGLSGYGTSTAEWSAGTGYDMATGLGTVNAANLVANWDKVSFAGSATTLATRGTTLDHGQPFTIKVDVTSKHGRGSKPTGDVALVTDKYGDFEVVTLDATGKFSGTLRNLPGGTYNLTARYGGDGTFASSVSAPVSLTVAPEASVVSFHLEVTDPNTGNPGPYTGTAQYESPLWVSVTVAGKSGQGLPTGTVNILNGKRVAMSAPLTSSGTAYISTGDGAYTFPVGTSTVSVQYLGDNSFDSGTSAPQQVTFQKQQVSTNVGISAYNVPAGQPVFFIASIPPGYGNTIPTGTFQFYDNGQPLGSPIKIVNNGFAYANATYSATLTTIGMHSITVGYSGDANFTAVSGTNPNLANPSYFNIVPTSGAATVTSIVQTPTTVAFGQSFAYIVTVTPVKKGGPVPTGQVLISSNNSIFGQATLVNGQGSVIMQANAGTAQVDAQYQGDSNYAASTSRIITTTVEKFTPPVSLTSTAPYVLPGQQTSLKMVVVGYSYGQYGYLNPQGSVQFFTAVNGGQPQAITPAINLLPVGPPIDAGASVRVTLPTGTNVVTAVYSGSQEFNSVTAGPVTIVVSNPNFTVSANPPTLAISAGGSTTDTLAVKPILGFSGAVSLHCAGRLPAGTTCGFSPSTLLDGGGQSNLTIAMQGPFTAQPSNQGAESSGSDGHASTVVVLDSSKSKVAFGTAVSFTAKVSGGNKPPTGRITFYDGTTVLGDAMDLSNGQARLTVSNLTIGTHSITAKYSGDSSHKESGSQALYEAITGVTTLQVVATSGDLSHTLNINLAVQ